MKATVDFETAVRPIASVNGMNNGPVQLYSDRTAEYRKMGVDFIRFHDTHNQNAKCVDVPFIFRDFDADENDPANYYFGETDAVIKGAVKLGAVICYRFGCATEGKPQIFMKIPKDFAKWARICCHILAHYLEGWANGFFYKENLKYAEIWNEADLPPFWADRESYIDFYATVAPIIKKRFPEIKIGPCGWAGSFAFRKPGPENPEALAKYEDRYAFFHRFLGRIKKDSVPFDFYAWHNYCASSRVIWEAATNIERLLEEFQLDAESINTEWANYSLKRDSSGAWYREKFQLDRVGTGTLACMIVLQQKGNRAACLYDTDERTSFCCLYNFAGDLLPAYYSACAWKILKDLKTEFLTAGETADFRLCAAKDGENAAVILTNEGEEKKITLSLKGLSPSRYEKLFYDGKKRLEKIGEGRFTGRALSLTLPKESFLVLKFSADPPERKEK